MRKGCDGKKEKKKRMPFLVATTSLPAVYRPNGYARTTTAGMPHARAKKKRLMEIAATASMPSVDRWNAACANFKGRCLQSKVMSVLATRLRYNAVKQNLPVSRKEKRLDSCGLLNPHEQMSTKNENPMECNASFVLLSNLTLIIFAGITF